MFTGEIQQDMAALLQRVQGILGRLAPRSTGALSPVPTPGHFQSLIRQAARRYDLPPQLLQRVIAAESGFNPQAVSSAGAMGLMQLMPGTAAELGVTDPFDPAQNVAAGAHYLRSLLDRFGGSLPLALAAYNARPAAVEAAGGIPPIPQTQAYVAEILGNNLDRYG